MKKLRKKLQDIQKDVSTNNGRNGGRLWEGGGIFVNRGDSDGAMRRPQQADELSQKGQPRKNGATLDRAMKAKG